MNSHHYLNAKYNLLYGQGRRDKKHRTKSNYAHADKRQGVKRCLNSGMSVSETSVALDIPLGSIYLLIDRWGLNTLVTNHGKPGHVLSGLDGRLSGNGGPERRKGKKHWTHGKFKFRGEFIPEDEVKTILAEFREQDLTIAQMAEECGVSPKTITNQLRRFGLQGGLRSGSRTPQWKGGHSKYRGPGWLTIRQEILERDGHKCTVCGMTQEGAREGGHGLSVHHIVPFEQTQDNSDGNLTTLCQSCHMVAEWELGNRSTV